MTSNVDKVEAALNRFDEILKKVQSQMDSFNQLKNQRRTDIQAHYAQKIAEHEKMIQDSIKRSGL